MFLYKGTPLLRLFAHDDVLRVLQHHAQQRTDTCRAGSNDENRIIFLDFRDSCCPEAGCKYISDKQSLLVRDTVRNPVESLVGIGDADEFCLTSVDAAAERPPAVRRLAVVDIAVLDMQVAGADACLGVCFHLIFVEYKYLRSVAGYLYFKALSIMA